MIRCEFLVWSVCTYYERTGLVNEEAICFRLASGVLPIGALFYITDVVAQKTRKVLGALLARRYIEVN